MRSLLMKLGLLAAIVACTSWVPSAQGVADTGQGASLSSIGPMTFGPDGTLFVADNDDASIFAFELGSAATSEAAGAAEMSGLDQTLAALLGTSAREIAITDLAVHPETRNAYVSVMRGQGASSNAALFRVDGGGAIEMIPVETLTYTKVSLPNAPDADPTSRRNPRASTITDMAFDDGQLFVAGLSNEEFSSKLRSIAYPFRGVDQGTSVEIFHGNHAQVETRSPVYTFLPYEINGESNLIAGYLCTPLVKFPLASLKPGEKVRGTTIAEFGAGNRPLDMILYQKDGQDFLLMSNNSRGVMKISTDGFADAAPITEPVRTETGGVPYETIASMQGVEQLDLLDPANSIVISRAATGALDLRIVPLP